MKGDVESGKKGTKKTLVKLITTIIYNYINPLTFFIYSLVTLIKNKINYKITIRYRYFLINLLGTSVDSLFGVFQDWGDDTIFFQLSQSNSG